MTPVPGNVLLVFPSVPYPLISGGHLRDWQILNILNRLAIRPHVLYFGAGETSSLASESPVSALAASVAFGGERAPHDRLRWKTVVRKADYVLSAHPRTHP